MRRVMVVLATAALMAVVLVSSAVPAVANTNFGVGSFANNGFFDDDGLFEDDDFFEDDGDEVDDVDVGDPFFSGDDICVEVVTEFEDGTTDVDVECEDVF